MIRSRMEHLSWMVHMDYKAMVEYLYDFYVHYTQEKGTKRKFTMVEHFLQNMELFMVFLQIFFRNFKGKLQKMYNNHHHRLHCRAFRFKVKSTITRLYFLFTIRRYVLMEKGKQICWKLPGNCFSPFHHWGKKCLGFIKISLFKHFFQILIQRRGIFLQGITPMWETLKIGVKFSSRKVSFRSCLRGVCQFDVRRVNWTMNLQTQLLT